MRFVFRADASVTQGSGHVMRCLTLAEELASRGHEIIFVSSISAIGWLSEHLAASGYRVESTVADQIDLQQVISLQPDWVVVDSYRIDAASISAVAEQVDVLAIVDGSTRGIDATLYLEQNLGSEHLEWARDADRVLAGSAYALIRDDFLGVRPQEPTALGAPPHLVAFMGGTDADGTIVRVAIELARVPVELRFTLVAPVQWHNDVLAALAHRDVTVIEPTPSLPSILGSANVIVSAAGTSAWDVCTLGIPSLFIGVVDNQSDSLAELRSRGVALGVDLSTGESIDRVRSDVARLAIDGDLRVELAARCAIEFDGRGKQRVADALERRSARLG